MRGETASPPALEVVRVSHRFGSRKALDDASLSAPQSAFTVLLGPNGAGKTTLFSVVTRLFENQAGAIRVLGHDLRRAPGAALSHLGVVFQNRTLDLDLSVLQNLQYHAALHGMRAADGRRRALEELARVGLADRARDKARTLSGGQMRRVEIARALLHRPRLLLLDEPTVGLDIPARQEILERVRALCATEGSGVLWATHLVDEVAEDDRLVILDRGQVRAQGPVEDVMARAGAPSVRAAFTRLTTAAGAPASAASP